MNKEKVSKPLTIAVFLLFFSVSIIPSTGTTDVRQSTICKSNNPPYVPYNESPANGSSGVAINVDLSWTGGDPDGDPVTYAVYFGTNSNPPKVVGNQSDTTYDLGTLLKEVTYYWRIVAWDNHGAFAEGPIWHFTTSNHHPPYLEIGNITGGFGVSAVVKNILCGDAVGVEWSIRFKGGLILFPRVGCIGGVIPRIEPICETTVHSGLVLGIGITEINVTASVPNGNTATKSTKSFILGPFVFIPNK